VGPDSRRGSACLVFLFLCVAMSTVFSQGSIGVDPAVIARLQQQVVNGSTEIKRSALAEIRNLQTASASRLAVPALRDKEPIVRATAASSVVFLPPSEASSVLAPLLNDRDEFVRREAAYAIGLVRDPGTVASLVRLMRSDKVMEVRTAAAAALGNIGSMAAVHDLVSILKRRPREEDEFLRRSAARSIGQIAQEQLTGDTDVVTRQNFLPEKFKDLDPASASLALPGFQDALDILIGMLQSKSESDDSRREAAFALGAIGDPRATRVLQTVVSSPDPYLAEIAREGLLKIARREN
jgi:HEAT repeat protein